MPGTQVGNTLSSHQGEVKHQAAEMIGGAEPRRT